MKRIKLSYDVYSKLVANDELFVQASMLFVVKRFLYELNAIAKNYNSNIEILYVDYQQGIPCFNLVSGPHIPHQELELFCDQWPEIYIRLFNHKL